MLLDHATVDVLLGLKRELKCLLGGVWSSSGARLLVQSTGLGDLFDTVVDRETQVPRFFFLLRDALVN